MNVYVQLGRYGDILGFLPVLYHKWMITGERQRLMVSHEFAGLLDGVSYVEPIIFKGHRDELGTALQEARAYGRVVNAQVNGRGVPMRKRTECFMRDSWNMVGYNDKWDQLSLVIDRRDAQREALLADRLLGHTSKPVVLVNTHSLSSPFSSDRLAIALAVLAVNFDVVDISHARAERLHDMLGVLDRALALITVDTSILHLADASNIAVCALHNPAPWYGSLARVNHAYHGPYDQFVPEDIVNVIRGMVKCRRRYVHVYPQWDRMDAGTMQRFGVAQQSWNALGKDWSHVGVHPERTSKGMGDRAALPYVRDVIEEGMMRCTSPHDVLVVTNTDVGMVPEANAYLSSMMNVSAVFGYRFNHEAIERPLTRMENLRGTWDGGLDFFAFTKWFWEANKAHFPDMIMGAPKWDLVYRDIIKRLGGGELHGCVFHQTHRSRWQDDPLSSSTAYNENIWKRHRVFNDPTRCYNGTLRSRPAA